MNKIIDQKIKYLLQSGLITKIETDSEESYKRSYQFVVEQLEFLPSKTDKLALLYAILSELRQHKVEHQKICTAEEGTCFVEMNYDWVIAKVEELREEYSDKKKVDKDAPPKEHLQRKNLIVGIIALIVTILGLILAWIRQ